MVFLSNTVILLLSWAGVTSLRCCFTRPIPDASQFHFTPVPSLGEQLLAPCLCTTRMDIKQNNINNSQKNMHEHMSWVSTQTPSLLTRCSHSTSNTTWLEPPSRWPPLVPKKGTSLSCSERRWDWLKAQGYTWCVLAGEEKSSNCVEQEGGNDGGIKDTR